MSLGLIKTGYHLEKQFRAPSNANCRSVIVTTYSKSKIVASARIAAREKNSQRVLVQDLSNHLTPYEEAWDLQKELVKEVLSGGGPHDGLAGFLLLVQHPSVYTLGSGSSFEHLRFDAESPPHPLFRTERGGEVTYHGPGQLVVYPVINLRRFQADLHWYLRSLEEVTIRALEDVSGLQGERISGLTGVWVGGQKVAAIGVRANKWVTYHGMAINITTDLAPFSHITPCGIADRAVTSVQRLLDSGGSLEKMLPATQRQKAAQLERGSEEAQRLMQEYAFAVKLAFADVFGACLEEDDALGDCDQDRAQQELPV